MKRTVSTDQLLTLGMALYADKRTMEQRVRGIFGRKRSTGFARLLAVVLCLIVGVIGFTTACTPVREETLSEITGAPVETAASLADKRAQAETADAAQTPSMAEPEPSEAPVAAPARIVREAVNISENRRLVFDADVEIPEVAGYSVTPVTRRVLTLGDYETMLAYLAPGVVWQLYDGRTEKTFGSFPADLPEDATGFSLRAAGENGETYICNGKINDIRNQGVYFCKYEGVAWQSDIRPQEDSQNTLRYFDAEWPVTLETARAAADKLIRDFGIEHMTFHFADKAFAGGDGRADTPASRGWLIGYAQSNNGLPVQDSYGTGFFAEKGDVAYTLPILGRLWIYVDETGVAQLDWQGICEQAEPTIDNVAILPPEQICDLLFERLSAIYHDDPKAHNTPGTTFTVKTLRLAAAIIGEPLRSGEDMRYNDGMEGLLIPAWEAIVDVSDTPGADEAYTRTDVYPFSATDGAWLVCKQFERSIPQ